MSAVDEILNNIDLNQLAQQVGAQPDEVRNVATAALPALLGGLEANAADPAGAASLAEALTQHSGDLASAPIDVSAVNTTDGAAIAQHVFGANQEQVVNQLGGVAGSSSLVKKIIPILAPIVLSYLAKQMGNKAAGSTAAAGGGDSLVSSILQEVLQGASQGSAPQGGVNAGSIIGNVLAGLLGGGRR